MIFKFVQNPFFKAMDRDNAENLLLSHIGKFQKTSTCPIACRKDLCFRILLAYYSKNMHALFFILFQSGLIFFFCQRRKRPRQDGMCLSRRDSYGFSQRNESFLYEKLNFSPGETGVNLSKKSAYSSSFSQKYAEKSVFYPLFYALFSLSAAF